MTGSAPISGRRVLRSSAGLVGLALALLIAVFLLGDVAVRGSLVQMLLIAPWVLMALWVVYEATAASFVRFDAERVVVQNMLRRTSFGWGRVRDIDFRWQLVFGLDDGSKINAMGGPSRSRPRTQTSREREVEGPRVPVGVRVLGELQDLRAAAPASADEPIRRTWDGPALISLIVIAAWATASVLLAGHL